MYFLGIWTWGVGYRLWDPVDKKLIRSRNVIFFEDQSIWRHREDEKLRSDLKIPVNLDPVPLQVKHDKYGGADAEKNNDDNVLEEPLTLRHNLNSRDPLEKWDYQPDKVHKSMCCLLMRKN